MSLKILFNFKNIFFFLTNLQYSKLEVSTIFLILNYLALVAVVSYLLLHLIVPFFHKTFFFFKLNTSGITFAVIFNNKKKKKKKFVENSEHMFYSNV